MWKGAQVAEKISLASAADVGTVAVIIISGVIDPMQTFVSCQWRATVLSAAVVRRMSQKLVPLQGRRPQYSTQHRDKLAKLVLSWENGVQLLGYLSLKLIGIDLCSKMADVKVGLSRRPVCPPREASQRS